ncbi:aldehyde dehydrogenase family protein, partial [Mycobacterium avium]
MFNSGQTCISVGRIYVEEPVYQDFTTQLAEEVGKIRQGHDASGAFTVLRRHPTRRSRGCLLRSTPETSRRL